MFDFNVEINNHLQWRSIIESIVSGQVSLDIPRSMFLTDNHCQLGKWLYSPESNDYQGNYHFNLLISDHKKFHQFASEIVAAYEQGDDQRVAQLHDEFYLSSDKVIDSLNKLKQLEKVTTSTE